MARYWFKSCEKPIPLALIYFALHISMAVDVNKTTSAKKKVTSFEKRSSPPRVSSLNKDLLNPGISSPWLPLALAVCDRMDPAARDKLLDVLQNDLKNISLESKRSKSLSAVRESAGLVTNSILFRWLFTFMDWCQRVRFQQTHNQGLRQLLLTVSWDLRA